MKDPDPIPGAQSLVRLVWPASVQPMPKKDDEVRLEVTRRGDVALQSAGATATVQAVSGADWRELERIRIGTAPYVALVVGSRVRPQGQPRGQSEIDVVFFRFAGRDTLPPQEIAVDDRVANTIAAWEHNAVYAHRSDRVISWLTTRFLLPPEARDADPARGRVIISAVRGGSTETASYRLHGRGVVADLHMAGDRLQIRRLRRLTADDRQRALTLVYTKVEFTDATVAGERRASMRPLLDKLAAGQGFLAMWQEYNRIEAQYLRRLVRRTGKVRYDAWERLADGTIRFSTPTGLTVPGSEPSLIENAREALGRGEALEVEAAGRLPALFTADGVGADVEEPDAWALLKSRQERLAFSGTITAVDPAAGTIEVRPSARQGDVLTGVGGDRGIQLTESGWLYRSYRGDQRQIARRKRAFDRILANGTLIPKLLALLEGERLDARPPEGHIQPESDAVRAIFDGRPPTTTQREAIDLALNTPDIAVIQGPPGTGKTDVIAAIQTRLAENGKSYAQLRGSILLASFQHSAVDEVAGRAAAIGIPTNRVDRMDRGATPLRDRFREDLISKTSASLGEPGEAVRTLRELTRKAAEYWLAPPSDATETVAILQEALRTARPHIPAELAIRVGAAADQLLATEAVPARPALSDERELALIALRALRTTPESFADDGPRTAEKALRRIRAIAGTEAAGDDAALGEATGGVADQGDLVLLREAAQWPGAQPPGFLADLRVTRDRLIDSLLRPAGPAPVPVADPDIVALLDETAAEMEESLRRSVDIGPYLALTDYLDALNGDPLAVEQTHRAYTTSYATTLQQADSRKIAEAKDVQSEDDVVFDTVIIDEAARANPLDLMIPMALAARRIVLVGDQNQLPPMLESDVERQVLEHNATARDALRVSLFQRLFEAHHDRMGPRVKRVVTLDEQFRMHEVLGKFVSRNFYGGTLRSPRGSRGFEHGLRRYGTAVAAWLDVPHHKGPEHRVRSTYRQTEADRTAAELQSLMKEAPGLRFGVISFYADQVEAIGSALQDLGITERAGQDEDHFVGVGEFRVTPDGKERLRVGSVDSFQGRQFDVVLLSTTRSAPDSDASRPDDPAAYAKWVRRRYGHLLLINRLCVAMSRQRRLLIVVGDAAMFDAARAPAEAVPLTDFLRICRDGGEHGRFLRD